MTKNKLWQNIYRQTLEGLFKSPLFWAGLVLKLLFSALFASKFLLNFFIPFVSYFARTSQNPYEYFISQGPPEAFPYPALMLYILTVPVKFFDLFVDLNAHPSIQIFIYRIPLLLADFTILVVLASWLKQDKKKVLLFYWLSPVLIYISYIHGQLDVIPMALVFTSLYFLIKDKDYISYLLLGCSLATKTHVMLIVPFCIAYSFSQKKSLGRLALQILTVIGTFLVLNSEFIFNTSFFEMVFKNAQQDKIFKFFFSFSEEHKYYLIPAAYCLLLVKGFSIKTYNKNILLMFLGFSFGIVTFFVAPSQGWYYWILPAFIFFYVRSNSKTFYALAFLQFLYFVYFLVIPESDYLLILSSVFSEISKNSLYSILESRGLDAQRIQDTIFTFLQTSVLLNCLYIYRTGIQSFTKQKISSLPYFIGIGGDSGAGKTTLSAAIQKLFSDNRTTVIRGDDMHKWERGDDNWKTFTHLNPKANELHDEYHLLSQLKKGLTVFRRHYDHTSGKFTSGNKIESNSVMIFEGLHPFYIKKMRSLYDLKIYVAPSQRLHHYWKINRDVRERGYTHEKVIQQMRDREQDSDKYIKVQTQHADIEVTIIPENNDFAIDSPPEIIKTNLLLKLSNDIQIEPILDSLIKNGCENIQHRYEGNDSQTVLVRKDLDAETIELIANQVIPNLDDLGIHSPKWEGGYLGLIQLFISYYITQQVNQSHET
jgi:uridine kinase